MSCERHNSDMHDPPNEVYYDMQRLLLVVLSLLISYTVIKFGCKTYEAILRTRDEAAQARLNG